MNRLPSSPIWALEDNDEDFELIFMALSKAGLDVTVRRFRQGKDLLDFLDQDTVRLPSLIYIDLRMPGIGGMAVLRQLEQIHRFDSVPKLVFSTSANPREINEAYASGANAFHVKRLDTAEMLSLLSLTMQYWLSSVALAGPSVAKSSIQKGSS